MRDADVELEVRDPGADQLPSDPTAFDGLVCLGGGMSVHDAAAYPWLLPLQRLLAEATSREIPTLGICLGAQLLASANGGRVAPTERPEVGPGLVSKRDAAWEDPLFGDLPLLPDVLQFHSESVVGLPSRAVLLASDSESANQAFRIGRFAYGMQFHIETTPETVADWARQAPELSAWARPGKLEPEVLAELHRDLAETWGGVAAKFAALVSGNLTPAGVRDLPLS